MKGILMAAVLALAAATPPSAGTPPAVAAPPAAAAQPALSAPLVSQWLESFDRDARALRVDALAGALAPDAAIVLRTRALGEPQEQRLTASAYLAAARSTLDDLRRDGVRYTLEAGEPAIVVEGGGARATATTQSTEQYDFRDGRRLTTVNRAVLRFEWRDGRVVVVGIEQDDLTPPASPASP